MPVWTPCKPSPALPTRTFYSYHYLAEVFRGDIKARLDAWRPPRLSIRGTRSTARRSSACKPGRRSVCAAGPGAARS